MSQADLRGPIWIDLDNTPHVPFFTPIISELKKRGYEVVVSARDAYQVCEVAEKAHVQYTRIGHHYGKNRFWKIWGTCWRAVQLLPFVVRHRPALAVSHGSRSQIFLSTLVGIPSVLILDYEFAKGFPLLRTTSTIVPNALAGDTVFLHGGAVRTYDGLKEDVYVPDFHPDGSICRQLGLNPQSIVVTVRPPATEAHYHNPEGEALLVALMQWLNESPDVQAVLLPRNKKQHAEMRSRWPEWFTDSRVIVPENAIDGLNLLWHSDVVVSGGGTMNREAAALGIPVYSIFRGHIGAVDKRLSDEGRLVLIENADELRQKVVLARRSKNGSADNTPRPALRQIVDHIEDILRERGAASF